jgi:hypothetical protein
MTTGAAGGMYGTALPLVTTSHTAAMAPEPDGTAEHVTTTAAAAAR